MVTRVNQYSNGTSSRTSGRLFRGSKQDEDERDSERPWHQNRPKTTARSPVRPVSPAKEGQQPVSRSGERNRRVTPPLPRIIRMPPNRWQETSAVPHKADPRRPSSSTNVSEVTREFGICKPPPVTALQKSFPLKRSPLHEPPSLSAAWLAQRLLTLNLENMPDDDDDDDGIIIRVQREYKNVSPTAALQSKPPQRRHDRPLLLASSSSSKTRETRRENEGSENSNDGGRTFSSPIEWDTQSDSRCGSLHEGNVSLALASDQRTGDHDEPGNEVTSSIIPPSLPVYSPGDVKKASSLGLLSGEVLDTLPPPLSPVASQDTDAASYLTQRNCIRLGSLRTETRWLSQSVAPTLSLACLGLTQLDQREKLALPISSSSSYPVASGIHNSTGQRRETQGQSRPTIGVNNVLGLSSPFMDADEDLLSDTASIALSFLSPESSSSSPGRIFTVPC
ncbi:hypothetical protein HPB51_016118 [Rhipicephalus microplus]|uniref:Uncharacterized protein n=1 Tax=Rhipicephalus microplus TaxID=6941 RepID=A0A9J6DVM2_RHIMP|nr:hypothetical protein HPB51_016118 [Rhipicephalus microplus]